MGATFSTSFDHSRPKNISLEHKDALDKVLNGLSKLCNTYPEECKTEFEKILTWTSTALRPAQFSHDTVCWTVKSSQKSKTTSVTSVENRSDGIPFFTLETNGNDSCTAHVSSFWYLSKVLAICGSAQLNEMSDIFASHKDIMSVVFGMPMDTHSLVKVLDAMRTDMKQLSEQEKKLFRLYLIINSLDVELMKDSLISIDKEKYINAQKAEEEIIMIKGFCGKEVTSALTSISWDTNFVFSNGCKAPPWRQIVGDIGYVDIVPKDTSRLTVTVTKKGYFVNKGYGKNETGAIVLDYEPAGEMKVFSSLIDLLKIKSAHFSANIEKQKYNFSADFTVQANSNLVPASKSNTLSPGTKSTQEKQQESSILIKLQKSEKAEIIKNSSPSKESTKKKTELTKIDASSKWKALERTASDYELKKGKEISNASITKKNTHASTRNKTATRSQGAELVDLSETEDDGSTEDEQEEKGKVTDPAPEYYQIQKLVRYLRCGNETATVIAICALRDFDLSLDANQYAIREVGGLETLMNLLDTESVKCKIGALKIIIDISQNLHIRNAISELDGMQSLVSLLRDAEEEVKCLAAEAISHCAKNAQNRRDVRRYGGIKKLIKLLRSATDSMEENAAIAGAMALATCSKSAKNKNAILDADAIQILATLMESKNESLLIPLVALLSECATDERYRLSIRKSGIITFLVSGLHSKNSLLQTHCASAIFKCAEDAEVCNIVRQCDGLGKLAQLLEFTGNKELLIAATGTVWKTAQNAENVSVYNKLHTVKKLVQLLNDQPEEVLVNVVGALGACAKSAEGRQSIRENGGIISLANLLKGTNQNLLINVTISIGECAHDTESMNIIDRLDGVRLLWSLLKSASPQVQASAAWAICPCIKQGTIINSLCIIREAKDAGEMVRSFVGGLELIISLLKSDDIDVLSSVCAAIAAIATDEENLAVISDHGAVSMLSKLTNTKVDKLRKNLAEAISQCCHWGSNCAAFGAAGAVTPLVKYLRSDDVEVHRSTAKALFQLSKNPDNCIAMYEHGVVQLLLGMVGSADTVLQEAAAGTIGNIRRLALETEKNSD